MDTLLRNALSAESRPELDSRFAQHVSSRIGKTKQVDLPIRVLLTIYWIFLGFFTIFEVAQISWPAWFLFGATLILIPATIAFLTRHPG